MVRLRRFLCSHGTLNGSAYFLDLGDGTGRAVKICAEGWELVDRPGIQFRRPEGMLPLPVPRAGGRSSCYVRM